MFWIDVAAANARWTFQNLETRVRCPQRGSNRAQNTANMLGRPEVVASKSLSILRDPNQKVLRSSPLPPTPTPPWRPRGPCRAPLRHEPSTIKNRLINELFDYIIGIN